MGIKVWLKIGVKVMGAKMKGENRTAAYTAGLRWVGVRIRLGQIAHV
jgi:hypothetical protein